MLNNQTLNNNLTPDNTVLTESRKRSYEPETLWDKLNLSQQYSVCSIGQFGYILTYVRTLGTSTLAILKLDGKTATINEAGIININPAIACRL